MSALVFLVVGNQVFFRPPSHPVTFHVDVKITTHLSPDNGPNSDGSLTNVQVATKQYDVTFRFAAMPGATFKLHGKIEHAKQSDPNRVSIVRDLNRTVIGATYDRRGKVIKRFFADLTPLNDTHYQMNELVRELGLNTFLNVYLPIAKGTTYKTHIPRLQYRPSGEQTWTIDGDPIPLNYQVTAISKTGITIKKSAHATIRLSTPIGNNDTEEIQEQDEVTLNPKDGFPLIGRFSRIEKDWCLHENPTRLKGQLETVVTITRKN